MRLPLILVPLVVFSACVAESDRRPPPSGRFYFPTGLHHVEGAPGSAGILYVASGNYDRRYDDGVLHAVDLDAIGLPAFPTLPLPAEWSSAGVAEIADLKLGAENEVFIRNFAGELDSYVLADGRRRLFVATRAEDSYINVVDAQGTSLDCASGSRSCVDSGPSLVAHALGKDSSTPDQPRAVQPIGVAVGTEAPFAGRVFITHLQAADSPQGTFENRLNYLVSFDAENPLALTAENYQPIAPGGANDVVLGKKYVYLSGRAAVDQDILLRGVQPGTDKVFIPNVQSLVPSVEGRGIVRNKAESRLYLAGRFPDALVVTEVQGPESELPTISVIRSLPMPAQVNELAVIERPGRGELVVATASGADAVVIYDSELGQIVNVIEGVGEEPYGLEVDPQEPGAGARLYVTNFSDGQVAVIDLPDLAQPTVARVVAVLGEKQ